MFIYDDTSLAFVQKCEEMVKEIILKLGFKVDRTRFSYNNYSYPINIVVYEGSEWGHFNPSFFQIGLNRKLIYLAKDSVLRDILKHELAHYFTFITYGNVPSHGAEYHDICSQLGFPSDISEATMSLQESNESKVGDLQNEKILERIKKLLQLAQSSNSHEAELATLKANELLLRHNLDQLKEPKKETIYLDRILQRSKKDAKIQAINEILKHFIVKIVFSHGKGTMCLEVSGSLTNVKLARYVGEFLDRELDHMWKSAQKDHGLYGLRAKNSFFYGVAKGFDQKMKKSKESFSKEDQAALVLVEKKLDVDTRLIYRKLSYTSSQRSLDSTASEVGVKKGHGLTIRQGVESKSNSLYLTSPKK